MKELVLKFTMPLFKYTRNQEEITLYVDTVDDLIKEMKVLLPDLYNQFIDIDENIIGGINIYYNEQKINSLRDIMQIDNNAELFFLPTIIGG